MMFQMKFLTLNEKNMKLLFYHRKNRINEGLMCSKVNIYYIIFEYKFYIT